MGEPLQLLHELHAAMADVMELRRPSATQAQREKAERAIRVWRKVEAFLEEKPNVE